MAFRNEAEWNADVDVYSWTWGRTHYLTVLAAPVDSCWDDGHHWGQLDRQ